MSFVLKATTESFHQILMHVFSAISHTSQLLGLPNVALQRFVDLLMAASNLVSSSVKGSRSKSLVPTFESLLRSVRFLFPVTFKASDVLPNTGATVPMNEGHMIGVLFILSIVLISL